MIGAPNTRPYRERHDLLEEPRKLDEVVRLAARWFQGHLTESAGGAS